MGDNYDAGLKEQVERLRGYWHPFHQGLLEHSPDYLRAYLAFQNAPAESGHLEPKVCEFIYIAVDSAVSHLYASGAERHIQMALDKGATTEEILEVIQLTTLSSHFSHEAGMPMLVEELALAGRAAAPGLTPEQAARKQAFIDIVGYWPDGGDAMFHYAPGFIEPYLRYAEIPYENGPLPRKIKEFIRIAVCATPAGPEPVALRRHIRLALAHGASPEEVSDVLQLASAIAIHTCTTTIPSLVKAIAPK